MNNILFFGTYQRKVDSKGRVSIPAEWRSYLIEKQFFSYIIYNKDKTKYSYVCKLSIRHIKDNYPKTYYEFATEMLHRIMQYNLDTEGRAVFKQEKGKTAILKGCGDYFTIEFRAC